MLAVLFTLVMIPVAIWAVCALVFFTISVLFGKR